MKLVVVEEFTIIEEFSDFDESKHPREHGRFAPAGGGGGALPVPTTEAGWQARAVEVESRTKAYLDEHGDTERQFRNENGEWSPERAALHDRLLDEAWAKTRDVPGDRLAVIMGGLPGAGKSTAFVRDPSVAERVGLEVDARGSITNAVVINPDDFKVALSEAGAVPRVPGLQPLEGSAVVHEESSYLALQLADRALAAGKNVVFDGTMSNRAGIEKRLGLIEQAGYPQPHAMFVSVPTHVSAERTESRWRGGVERGDARYVPTANIHGAYRDGDVRSANQEIFGELRGRFANGGVLVDNTGDRPVVQEH